MQGIRWYDKNPNLKKLFDYIASQTEEEQQYIAHTLLQVLINDFDINFDEEISEMSKSSDYTYKRWSDFNVDLFSIIEITKTLPFEKQALFALKSIDEIFFDSVRGNIDA